MTRLAIDPTAQSLQDFAAAISGVDNIQAVVNAHGSVQIIAEPGYKFDFAHRLQSNPDTSGISGSTEPQLTGSYAGAQNEQLAFEFTSSGTVGVRFAVDGRGGELGLA